MWLNTRGGVGGAFAFVGISAPFIRSFHDLAGVLGSAARAIFWELVRSPPPDTHSWRLAERDGDVLWHCSGCGGWCKAPRRLEDEDRDCAKVLIRHVLES